MLLRAYKFRFFLVAGVMASAGAMTPAGEVAPGGALGAPTVKGDVSIQLPKGWAVSTGTGDVVLVASAPQPDRDLNGQFCATLSISRDAGNKVDGAAVQKNLASALTGYRVIENLRPNTPGGLQGVAFSFAFHRGPIELHTRQYMFVVNNQIYTVVFTSLDSSWDRYQAAIEASVATLAVKK